MRCKDQISPPDPNSQNRQPPSSCRFRIRFKVTIAVVSRWGLSEPTDLYQNRPGCTFTSAGRAPPSFAIAFPTAILLREQLAKMRKSNWRQQQ